MDRTEPGRGLTSGERDRLAAIRSARTLPELADATGVEGDHEAYLEAKSVWYDLRGRTLPVAERTTDEIPGTRVDVDCRAFRVHGITHADTDAERAFLREHISRYLDADESVYCEQGVRLLYFADVPDVREMDDLRWAMRECDRRGLVSNATVPWTEFDGLAEEVDSLTDSFREAAFSLVNAGTDLYGERFRAALGDVASAFLTGREAMATGEDFESFTRTRRAAADPARLGELQRYYARRFLPQPLEREWLRRHDPELELVTHARNARMADYARYHADATTVHLLVGAAHQPGVVHYLGTHRDGRRSVDGFEPL